MSDRRETKQPQERTDMNCARCGSKIQGLRIETGRGVYRWLYVEPDTKVEHRCANTRGQR